MGQKMNGLFIFVPTGTIEVIPVFGKTCKVEDAELGRTTGPIFVVGCGLAQIVEARPHKFTNHPGEFILKKPVFFRDV